MSAESPYLPWAISGTYLESCNCDAICPCRRIDGVQGGRSTHGICEGALSWKIEDGRAGDVGLSALNVVVASRYSDDKEGSPWDFFLYVDDRAGQEQFDALTEIYLGRLGGTVLEHFPWAWKDSRLIEAKPARIEIDHTPGRGWFRVADVVTVAVSGPLNDESTVTCVIPGHEREGSEITAETLRVTDGPLDFEFAGVCGFEATFAYGSESHD